jgi:predicted Zn-dependent protease
VLGEYAVAEVLEYLAFMAFSGLAIEEGRACLELGQPIFGSNVTIWDDGADPTGIPTAIDFEGVAKRKVALVTDGVAVETAHDTATAHRARAPLTGHGLPAPNTFGPLCWNLFMAPGEAPRDALAAGIERGLLVTRFHYVNIVHPKKGILTGMTRDGTFRIEDGKVAGPVRNLRFTQSIPDAFSRISAIADTTRLVGAEYTGIVSRVPAVRIDGWNFTGVTANEATV